MLHRSLLIYFLNPLYTAGVIIKEKISKLEAEMRKKYLLPNDIESAKINSIYKSSLYQRVMKLKNK